MTLLDLSMTNKTRMNDQFQKRQEGEASEKSSACSSAGPSSEEPTERKERPTSRYQLFAQQFSVSWNKVSLLFWRSIFNLCFRLNTSSDVVTGNTGITKTLETAQNIMSVCPTTKLSRDASAANMTSNVDRGPFSGKYLHSWRP